MVATVRLQDSSDVGSSTMKLPDFFATRTTVSYEQKQRKEEDTWKTALADQSLHEAATDRTTILYRNGHEERSNQKKKGRGGERERDEERG